MTAQLRFFLAAFGEPGHAFPMLALGSTLAARGHEVTFETWHRWREYVEAEGMQFVPAPEHPVARPWGPPLTEDDEVVLSARETRQTIAEVAPHAVVHDILTVAPALAGELEGVPVATLIPHVHPAGERGFPPYALGARMPRTPVGRRLWTSMQGWMEKGLRQGREELNATRGALGLPPVARLHGGLSQALCLVATFPQLEYPRTWLPGTHVVGPIMWEPPFGRVGPPPGDKPMVLVAPTTAQDPEHRLLRAALAGLGGEPIRVLATWNRRPLPGPAPVAENMRLVEWVSYSKTMPECALVICHAGHGTMVRALASGAPVLCVPHAGDMAENAARADWAGAGVRLPWRLLAPATLRLAVRYALGNRGLAARARELAAWAAVNDGAVRAAELVEELAVSRRGAGAGISRRGASAGNR